MILKARQFEFVFPRPALVMGILNVTPDSFADGGRYSTRQAAVEHALQMAGEGADMIDIGGESTRPGSLPVDEKEELSRVIPVIEALAARLSIPISIDTMKTSVAQAALKAGASIVNNIAAGRADSTLWRLIAESGAGYVVVHMKGGNVTQAFLPVPANNTGRNACVTLQEVDSFFDLQLKELAAHGVSPDQIMVDVGIGFGKELEHNLELLAHLQVFTKWRRPVLLGVSRKSFIGKITGTAVNDRLAESLACACWAVQNGVQIIRTHDVAATRQALGMTEALIQYNK